MKKLKTLELNRISEDEFKKAPKNEIILFLDNIRSMHNVGASFRTADAFLCKKIILSGICPQPPHREIHKSALGAENTVDWEYHENGIDELNSLKKQGYLILPLEQAKGSTSLENLELLKNQKVCLIVGNEVFGVRDEIIEICDKCLEIPQFGTKHSLNVSVSLGIALWEIVKKSIL